MYVGAGFSDPSTNREPRTTNHEPGTANLEPGTANLELNPEPEHELRTENREARTTESLS